MRGFKQTLKLLLVFTLLTMLLVTGCSQGSQTPGGSNGKTTVKILIAQPLTGASANDGTMSRDGALLALEQMKSKPELANYDIQVISEDDKSDPKDATAIANKWAGDKDLLAVVGNYNSSCTLAGASVFKEKGIPQIATGSSSPTITGHSSYLFRTQPTDALVGKNIVEWAESLGYKKAAIIYENSDYGKGLGDLYKEMWKGEIVAEESFIPGSTTDFTPILSKIKELKVDCVLLGSLYNEAALMGKQAKQVGLNTVFFGDSSLHTNALIELGGDGAENFHVIGALNTESEDEKIAKFIQDFEAKYGHKPNTFASQSYDAMALVLDALAEVGPDREKVKDWLTNLKAYPGITGALEFIKGDVQKDLFRYVVKDGVFVEETR